MNLDKFLEMVFNNPDNISIEYSNINGKEKLIVNGKDMLEQKFDDSDIKNRISLYKENIGYLDEWIWNVVIDEATKRNFNLSEMDKILNLESFTKEQAEQAKNIIVIMNELIRDIPDTVIQSMVTLKERF